MDVHHVTVYWIRLELRRAEAATHPPDPGFSTIVQREGGLKRTLSAAKLSMIAIGGAIGTGLFLGSGFAIGTAGPGVLISYAIGALIGLLLMGCLAEMTIAHPTTGSFGAYAEYYIGPLAGFVVRYAYWTCVVLAVGTEVTAVALYMKFWFPAVPGWIWILGFSSALIVVNAFSVSAFGSVEYWFSLIKITAIVAFIVLAAHVIWASPDSAVAFETTLPTAASSRAGSVACGSRSSSPCSVSSASR